MSSKLRWEKTEIDRNHYWKLWYEMTHHQSVFMHKVHSCLLCRSRKERFVTTNHYVSSSFISSRWYLFFNKQHLAFQHLPVCIHRHQCAHMCAHTQTYWKEIPSMPSGNWQAKFLSRNIFSSLLTNCETKH